MDFLLLENGDRLTLEDDSGSLVLETGTPAPTPPAEAEGLKANTFALGGSLITWSNTPGPDAQAIGYREQHDADAVLSIAVAFHARAELDRPTREQLELWARWQEGLRDQVLRGLVDRLDELDGILRYGGEPPEQLLEFRTILQSIDGVINARPSDLEP